MSDANLSAVLYGKDDLRLENTPIKEPGPGEVKLEMRFCGICGTDLHLWSEGGCGSWYRVEEPTLIGHEGSAIVAAVGKGVTHLKVGDRVTIEPTMPCRTCSYCTEGRYNLCPDIKLPGLPGEPGYLKNFHTHRADLVFKLPDNVSLEEGAFMEPLSVAVQACNRANIVFGNKMLICGAGTIGLLCMLTAKAYGATKVCITDVSEVRLKKAKELGADYTVLIKDQSSLDLAKQIEDLLGEQAHISMECSGSVGAVPVAVYSTRPGGRVMIVGICSEELVPTPICNAGIREIEIIGVCRFANCFPRALELVASGKVDVKPMITHHYSLNDLTSALEIVRQRSGVKVMINCKQEKK